MAGFFRRTSGRLRGRLLLLLSGGPDLGHFAFTHEPYENVNRRASATDQKTGQQMICRRRHISRADQTSKEAQVVEGSQDDAGRESKDLEYEGFQSTGIVGVGSRLDQDD